MRKIQALPNNLNTLTILTRQPTFPFHAEPKHYYRFSVDEWARWDRDGFTTANALLIQANERFAAMHSKADTDYSMDEFEIAHANVLLGAVVSGLEAARSRRVFGGVDPFLAVWISDSGHAIIPESIRRLNSAAVVGEFMAEFGASFSE